MYSKNEQQSRISNEIVEAAIERVNKRHYLGAANHKVNPTGGINGYYRNVASRVNLNFLVPQADGTAIVKFYTYLMSACVNHTGSGNCGELAGALYLELFLDDNLSQEQKKLIQYRSYKSTDVHAENSYVLADATVYDIWDSKKYKKSRLKAETHVAEKYHSTVDSLSPTMTKEMLKLMKESIFTKFSKLFDEEIAKDRKNGFMYVTLDKNDPSNYALWASDSFPYLFKKFKETVEDPYFLAHPSEARIIQEKILKDYIYLIEELRQDILPSGPNISIHPNIIKYSHDQIADALRQSIPNRLFVDFVLAMSYINTNWQLALESFKKLESTIVKNSVDALEVALGLEVSELIAKLSANIVEIKEENTTELNPNHFFASSSKMSNTESSVLDQMNNQTNIDNNLAVYNPPSTPG